MKRTSAKVKARAIAKLLRDEHPDYNYLKSVFRHLRTELNIEVTHSEKKLPKVPTEEELHKYYQAVWKTSNVQDMVIIKTFLYRTHLVSQEAVSLFKSNRIKHKLTFWVELNKVLSKFLTKFLHLSIQALDLSMIHLALTTTNPFFPSDFFCSEEILPDFSIRIFFPICG